MTVTLFHFLKYCFQTFFKFTAIFSSSNKGTDIKRDNRFIFQPFWNVFSNDSLC
ncbi:hypothetical protein SAMD00023519_02115 [Listeria monocytogenes]|nr:hypothetical protein SAMD00023519_02115 [Listeria monocytogenes]